MSHRGRAFGLCSVAQSSSVCFLMRANTKPRVLEGRSRAAAAGQGFLPAKQGAGNGREIGVN